MNYTCNTKENIFMTEVVIAGAAHTPVGSFTGTLSTLPAHELGAITIAEALSRAKVIPKDVSEVILGLVLSAGVGQNPARQAAIRAGIPVERTAYVLTSFVVLAFALSLWVLRRSRLAIATS